MKLRHPLLCLILICSLTCAQDKNPINTENSHEIIVSDLNIPWGFTFLPDGSMLINEKSGELIHFKNGKKTTILGLPEIYVRGQGGLMDIVLHPNYKEHSWIYFSYASAEGEGEGGNTAIARAKLNGNRLDNLEVLYKATPNTKKGQHFGSRIVFDKDGTLIDFHATWSPTYHFASLELAKGDQTLATELLTQHGFDTILRVVLPEFTE